MSHTNTRHRCVIGAFLPQPRGRFHAGSLLSGKASKGDGPMINVYYKYMRGRKPLAGKLLLALPDHVEFGMLSGGQY